MFKKILLSCVIASSFNLLNSDTTKAQSIMSLSELENNSMSQINSVSQLRDVNPTDWSYQALRELVERYGCIVGYPDRTFRGDKSISRYEFAAGLNACLNSMERIIQESSNILQEDIELIKRLAKEYQTELGILGTKIDNLESRVAFVEDHSFSTNTTLRGENIMVFSGVWGNETAAIGEEKGKPITDGQITVNYRTRFDLDTSFTSEDLLKIRLQMGNFPFARGGSNLTDFNFSAGAIIVWL